MVFHLGIHLPFARLGVSSPQMLKRSIFPVVNDVFSNISGGLRAVIFTDTLQAFILIAGAMVVTIICECIYFVCLYKCNIFNFH